MKTLYERLCESFFDNIGGSSFELINSWCKNNIRGKYKIDRKTLTINSSASIKIINKSLTEFPSYIHFGTVNGDFICSNCGSLKSLKGVPKEVGGGFYCQYCDSLKSLVGAPEKVDDDFWCNSCDLLTSLEGAPNEVGGDFFCRSCDLLTSLEGISPNIKGKIVSDIK